MIKDGVFVIASRGVIQLYYSTRCKIEKTGGVYSVTMTDSGLNPPDILSIAVSPDTFSVFYSEYEEQKEAASTRLGYFDFGREGQNRSVAVDFKAFRIELESDGAKFEQTERGVHLEFRGFLTKENRKTDTMTFFIDIFVQNAQEN